MAKDGYVPPDGNAGDLAVGEQSVAGSTIAPIDPAVFAIVSGTPLQVDTDKAVSIFVPVTMNPSAIHTASCDVQISSDGITYTDMSGLLIPAGTAGNTLTGTILALTLSVPKGWWLIFTLAFAVAGQGYKYG